MVHRTLFIVGIGMLVAAGAPVAAQPGAKDSKRLEAEIANLRERIQKIQTELSKLQPPAGKQGFFESKDKGKKDFFEGKGKKNFFEGKGKKDFFEGKGKKDFFEGKGKGKKEFGKPDDKGETKKGLGGGFGRGMGGFGPGFGPGGPGGFGKGGFGPGFGKGPPMGPSLFGKKGGEAQHGTAEWHEQRAKFHMEAARELRREAAEEARKKATGRRGPDGGKGRASVEERIDQLQRAIEELRRELRQSPSPGLRKVGPKQP